MGEKSQREYLKRGRDLSLEERQAIRGSIENDRLYKTYHIEDLETGDRQTRGSVVAEEEGKTGR